MTGTALSRRAPRAARALRRRAPALRPLGAAGRRGSAARRRRSCATAPAARGLLDELAGRTAEHGLHGFPAAQGVGGRLAGGSQQRRRPAARAQPGDARRGARRPAPDDAARLPRPARGDARRRAELAGFHPRWEARLREVERDAARGAAIELGCEPAARSCRPTRARSAAPATASRAPSAARARRSTARRRPRRARIRH